MVSRSPVANACWPLRREPVDRTPACNPTSVATVELMDLADAPFPDANRKPELMARLAATGYTELGFDTIMPVFTIIQESSALAARCNGSKRQLAHGKDAGTDLTPSRKTFAFPELA